MTFGVNRVLGTADSQVPIKGEKNQKKSVSLCTAMRQVLIRPVLTQLEKKKIAYLHVLLREKCVLTLHIHC